jgi:replicative DNA helicase
VLAKELDITVIALAQLSRKCEERSDKRPMLSDIRESGSIEQDADVILFPFRQNYYDRADIEIEDAELIIAKNRHGEVGMIKTTFTPARTLYKEL